MREADAKALLARAAALRAQKAESEPAPKKITPAAPTPEEGLEGVEWLEDTLDELPQEAADVVDEDAFMRRVLDGLDIVSAYDRYVGKTRPSETVIDGEMKVSCPLPDHADRNPSACLNVEKNQWVCYRCQDGGDTIGMIGRVLMLDPHVPQEYMALTKQVCRDLGYEFWTDSHGRERVVVPGEEDRKQSPKKPVKKAAAPTQEVLDPEEMLEKGLLTRKQVAAEPEDADWLENSLDELDEVGGKRYDGKTKKDAVMDRLRAKRGDEKPAQKPVNPSQKAPEQPKTAPETPKKTETESNSTRKYVKKTYKFSDDSTDDRFSENLPPKGSESAKTPPKAEKSSKKAPKQGKKFIDMSDEELDSYRQYAEDYRPGEFLPVKPGTPTLDLDRIVPKDSMFIRPYLEFTCKDAAAPEWHFWCALQAVGFAAQRDVWIDGRVLYGNLFICLVGRSGSNKTQAQKYLGRLMKAAFPVSINDENSDGVRVAHGLGSGEKLVKLFQNTIEKPDPSWNPPTNNPNAQPKMIQVTGGNVRPLVLVEELSSLNAKNKAENSTLRDRLITMYDSDTQSTLVVGREDAIVDEPFGMVNATTQPGRLSKLVESQEIVGGYISRWVFATGREKMPFPLHNDPDGFDITKTRLVGQIQKLRAWCVARNDEGRGEITFEAPAEKLWTGFFAQEILKYRWSEDADVKVRVDALMKKLMLLFAIDLGEQSVTREIVMMAMRCWDYITGDIDYLLGNLNKTEQSEGQAEILATMEEMMDKGPDHTAVKASELYAALKNRPWARSGGYRPVIDELIRNDVIYQKEDTQPKAHPDGTPSRRVGRPPTMFCIR